jgi:hypothetical protein
MTDETPNGSRRPAEFAARKQRGNHSSAASRGILKASPRAHATLLPATWTNLPQAPANGLSDA